MSINSIVTIGISPAWDMTCHVEGIEWGEHKKIVSQTLVPAGKALNISKALNGLGIKSIAAGLWGQPDYSQMRGVLSAEHPLIEPSLTLVDGKTRTNLNIVDTKNKREMHLRSECGLAGRQSLKRLADDLAAMDSMDTAVFAGATPDEFLDECLSVVNVCRRKGAKIAVDTSGAALETFVKAGGLYLIKPNFEELCQLLGQRLEDDAASIISAARSLCDSVDVVLVSRGARGALAITKEAAVECAAKENRPALSTVACGDYLLAGFLSQTDTGDMSAALSTGVRVATAKVWGLTEEANWHYSINRIEVDVKMY